MPIGTEIERRNRALVAFTLLTDARGSAIASMKSKHVDFVTGCVYQDAKEVKTKFSKTFNAFFFLVGEDVLRIVSKWVSYLWDEKLLSIDDPLFPSALFEVGPSGDFEATGGNHRRLGQTSSRRIN